MSKTQFIIRRMTLVAMLTALASVIKILFQLTSTPGFRITFYELPLIIVGGLFGPMMGGIAGFITDIVYLMTYGYDINLMTVSTMMWGVLSGFIIFKSNWSTKRVILLIVVASILEFFINGVQLLIWAYRDSWNQAFLSILPQQPLRILILILKWPIQIVFIKIIYDRVVETFKQKYQ